MTDSTEVIDVWKSIVEVQMHFNEICMKIRSFFVTLVIATMAGYGYLIEKSLKIELLGFDVYYFSLVPFLGVAGGLLLYFMDRHWYHRLLVGAVKQGIVIEAMHAATLPEISLSKKIGDESPIEVKKLFYRILLYPIISDKKYADTKCLHSDAKIQLFYKSVIYLFLVLSIISMVFLDGVTRSKPTLW